MPSLAKTPTSSLSKRLGRSMRKLAIARRMTKEAEDEVRAVSKELVQRVTRTVTATVTDKEQP